MNQSGLLQLTLCHICRLYSGTKQIFTDGSCTPDRSSSGIFISSTGQTFSYRLERATSSMSAELHAIKEAIRYILRQPPGHWTIFTDSKAALQSLLRNDCFSIHDHASRERTYLHHKAKDTGHQVTFPWLSGHCGV